MSREELLLDLVKKILLGKYRLYELRRSNSNSKQEYDFVIKKASSKETSSN